MKVVVTVVAILVSAALVMTGLYGFLHDLPKWGGPLLLGTACGFVTMCAAYNAE